jgi:hypothetical protein
MFHSYDYISLFMALFDIPVSLGSLFQRITSVNDRFYLLRLNKVLQRKVLKNPLPCHHFFSSQ